MMMLLRFFTEDDGADLIEYALLAATIGAVCCGSVEPDSREDAGRLRRLGHERPELVGVYAGPWRRWLLRQLESTDNQTVVNPPS